MGDQNENHNLNLDQLEISILYSSGVRLDQNVAVNCSLSKEDAYYFCEEFRNYPYNWLVSTLLFLTSKHTLTYSAVKLYALTILSESLGNRPGASSSSIQIALQERLYLKEVLLNIIALSIENDRKFAFLQNLNNDGNDNGQKANEELANITSNIEELIHKISSFFHEFSGGNEQFLIYISKLKTNLTFSSLEDVSAADNTYFTISNLPSFICNKFVYCITLLLNLDYPTSWESPFEDLMTLVQNASAPSIYFYYDMFFRFMNTLNEEVISREITEASISQLQVTTTIKDTLRKTDTASAICDLTYNTILHTCEEGQIDLCKLALTVLSQLIAWVDMRLIVNETYLDVYYTLLREPLLGPQAAQCLLSLVKRGMTINHKILFFSKINLFEVLQSLPSIETYLNTDDTSTTLMQNTSIEGMKGYVIFGELIDAIGCLLIKAWLFNIDLLFDTSDDPSKSNFTDLILLYHSYGEDALIGAGSNNENMPVEAITTLADLLNIKNEEELTPLYIYSLVTDYLHIYMKLLFDVFAMGDPDLVKTTLESLNMLVAEILLKQENLYQLLNANENDFVVGGNVGDKKSDKDDKRMILLSFHFTEYLPTLFWCIVKETKYPLHFQFDPEDEDENLLEDYKEEIRKLLTTMVRVAPGSILDLIIEYWTQIFEYLNTNANEKINKFNDEDGKMINVSDVEAALRLIWLYGTATNGQDALADGKFTELLHYIYNNPQFYEKKVNNNDLSNSYDNKPCEHFSVLLQFYEVIFRYSSFLKNNQPILSAVLENMISSAGILHPSSPILRARVAYMLPRLLKTLKDYITDFGALALSIAEILSSSTYKEIISSEMEEFLFECIGIFASMPTNDPMLVRNLMASVIEEHIVILNAICSNNVEQPDFVQVSHALRVITRICTTGKSSNFQKHTKSNKSITTQDNVPLSITYLREYFSEIFQLVNNALFTNEIDFSMYISGNIEMTTDFNFLYITDSQIRERYSTLIHRMVAMVGDELLVTLQNPLIGLLLFVHEAKEIIDYVTLINNLMIKYRSSFIPILEVLFTPLCSKLLLYAITPAQNEVYEVDQQSQIVLALKILIPNKKDNSIYTPLSNITDSKSSCNGENVVVATHIEAEKSGLIKSFLHFLHHIIAHENTLVLISQADGNLLLPLFSSLMDIAINASEGALRKNAFGILSSFFPAICEGGNLNIGVVVVEQIIDYYYKNVLPTVMIYPFMSCFDLSDAETLSILMEMANLLGNVYRFEGDKLINFLSNSLPLVLQNNISDSISKNQLYLDTVNSAEANSFVLEKQKLVEEMITTIIEVLTTHDFKAPRSTSTKLLQKSLLALGKAVQNK